MGLIEIEIKYWLEAKNKGEALTQLMDLHPKLTNFIEVSIMNSKQIP